MPPLNVSITDSDHIQGNIAAPITLLEYGDYECSYCGLAYPIVKRVQDYFAEQLRFVFRHFPLTEIHPHAQLAAETAEFAAQYGHFWDMHDHLFENQTRLGLPLFVESASELKLPTAELETALEHKTYQTKVKNDFLSGVHSGVNGTPTFFINGKRHQGSFNFEDLVITIEQISR